MAFVTGLGGVGRGAPRKAPEQMQSNGNQVGGLTRNGFGANGDGGSGGSGFGGGGGFGNGGYNAEARSSARQDGCFKCGETGHRSRDCPNAGGRPQGDNFGNRGGGRSFGGGFGGGSGATGGFGSGSSGGDQRGGFASGSRDRDSESSGPTGGFGSGGRGKGFGAIREETSGMGGFGRPSGVGGGGFGGRNEESGSRYAGGDNCRNCGESGHFVRECPQPRAPREGGTGDDLCRRCNQPGHFSRECTQEMTCTHCNQSGHMRKDCTTKVDGRLPPSNYIPAEEDVDQLLADHIHTGINFERYQTINVFATIGKSKSEAECIQSFEQARFEPEIMRNLKGMDYKKPTPVQKFAIPNALKGYDVMACAQTGSGKTAAFILPIIQEMLSRGEIDSPHGEIQMPYCLVVSPTRELALQIYRETVKFTKDTGIKAQVIYGGTNTRALCDRLTAGFTILVATPGRLMDFCDKGRISLERTRYLVLDEADRMLSVGFEDGIRKITNLCPPKNQRQTFMFSATFPEQVQVLAQEHLKDDYLFVAVGILGGANTDITQEFLLTSGMPDKKEKLVLICQEEISKSENGKVLVFVERKRTTDFLAAHLSNNQLTATSIHSDRLQKEREAALADFKAGRCRIMIATDVAARGLDIPKVDLVINFDLPGRGEIETYVHRIGRTGRVGNPGRAVTFFDPGTDGAMSTDLVKVLSDAGQNVPSFLGGENGGGMSSDWGGQSASGGGAIKAADDEWG